MGRCLLCVTLVSVVACLPLQPSTDAGADAGDSTHADAGDGGATLDASVDAGTDVDGGTDAGQGAEDASADAGAPTDAGADDAGGDAGEPADAGADAGSEVDAGADDAGVDAGSFDAGTDAGVDAGTDAGIDAGPVPVCEAGVDPFEVYGNNNVTAALDAGIGLYGASGFGDGVTGMSGAAFTAQSAPGAGCPAEDAGCRTWFASQPTTLLCSGADTSDWYRIDLPQSKALVRFELCAVNLSTLNPFLNQGDYQVELYSPNDAGGVTPTCDSDGGALPAGCELYFCSDLQTVDPYHQYCDCIYGANVAYNRCRYYNRQNLYQVATVSMGSNLPDSDAGRVEPGTYYLRVYTNLTDTAKFRAYRLAMIEWDSYPTDMSIARTASIPCTNTTPWQY